MTDQVPEIDVVSARRSIWDRVSIVWLVPVAALIIALGVAWQSYAERGPLIEIVFEDTAGVAAGETELRFHDVSVGLVEEVSFTDDLQQVVVGVRVRKDLAPYVDENASFWIVRPEVTAQGVTGLDTVLSGVYLEGLWDEVPGEQTYRFDGLPEPPLRQGNQAGLAMTLTTTEGSLSGNTPILYRGVSVGQVGRARVSDDGETVEAPAIVYAPYDNLITEATRFWDTSGFAISLGATGAAIDFESISSLIAGGITFDTFISGAPLAEEGAQYSVFSDETSARSSIFEPDDEEAIFVTTLFDGNIAGLAQGARVELNGLGVGQVRGVQGIVTGNEDGDTQVRLRTILSIQPGRIGLDGEDAGQRALDFIENQVENGLRARLVTASILTGGLKVELLTVPDAAPRRLDRDYDPYPLIPSTESNITDVQSSAEDTLARINALPIEELLQGASDFLNSASRLIGSSDTQQVPGEVSALLAEIRGVVGAEEVQALPGQVGGVMTQLESTLVEVRAVVTAIEEEQIVAELRAALESVTGLTDDVEAALGDVPALVAELDRLAQKANGLEVEELVSELSRITASANNLISSDAARSLPERIDLLARDLQVVAADVASLTTSLSDAQAAERLLTAIDTATTTLETVDTAFAGVPELVTEIEALAVTANDLPLPDLAAEVTALSAEARSLVGSQEAQALAGRVGTLTGELEATLAEIRTVTASLADNDAAERLLDAVSAIEDTMRTVDASLAGIPALVTEVEALLVTANELPLQTLVAEVTALSADARGLVGSAEAQALPGQIGTLAGELEATLAEIRTVTSSLVANDAAARLLDAVSAVEQTLQSVDSSIEGVPDLIANINAVAEAAAAVPLEEMIADITEVSEALVAILGSEATQQLPGQLSEVALELDRTLNEVRTLVSELNASGAGPRLVAAIDSAASTLETLDRSIAGVPEIVDRVNAIAAEAESLDLATLVDRATRLVASAESLVAAEGTQGLPDELNAALAEIRRILADFREGGAVGNVNEALVSARNVADELAVAVDDLPALLERTTRLIAQADSTLAGFEGTSPAIRDARAALADISRAAAAVGSLARAIERRPNSLLTGR